MREFGTWCLFTGPYSSSGYHRSASFHNQEPEVRGDGDIAKLYLMQHQDARRSWRDSHWSWAFIPETLLLSFPLAGRVTGTLTLHKKFALLLGVLKVVRVPGSGGVLIIYYYYLRFNVTVSGTCDLPYNDNSPLYFAHFATESTLLFTGMNIVTLHVYLLTMPDFHVACLRVFILPPWIPFQVQPPAFYTHVAEFEARGFDSTTTPESGIIWVCSIVSVVTTDECAR